MSDLLDVAEVERGDTLAGSGARTHLSAGQALNSALAEDLIELIKKQPPQCFEVLVVQLMQAMGYGSSTGDSGSATQYTGDGIINEDPLGLETICLQAKRYTDAAVGRPEGNQYGYCE
ncbi:MAG: restriction endonuclease [Pseudomonadota bacterium]|nr:restriction endonuclease [Pseudomonadota bacterium]